MNAALRPVRGLLRRERATPPRPTLAQLLYLAEHLDADGLHENTCLGFGDFDAVATALRCHRYPGPAIVLEAGGVPYYAAGLIPVNPGVSHTWSLSTADRFQHAKEMTRATKDMIEGVLWEGVHRVQIMCLESHTKARRWYAAFGAEHEATLRGAGRDGEDVVIYSIVRSRRHVP